MTADLARRIEKNIQRAASALFAAAVGYAAYTWLAQFMAQPVLGAETGGAGAIAYLLASRSLNAVRPRGARLPVAVFDVRTLEPFEPSELVLDEADRADRQANPPLAGDPLVLDDILAEISPDSRVVRLFDPAAMPTPAELRARIDRHLDRPSPDAQSAEAAEALNEALAQLRRNVR
jgi:hypothetical protein